MTDYVKSTDFAAKDALISGSPAKVIKGTEIGAEFDALEVSIASKADNLWTPAGTGAVSRTVQSGLRQIVSVKDFGATGDGSTDDATAIAAAVAHCYSVGESLLWPAGNYKTTLNIANFHDIKHVGKGVVVQGTDNFYISPTQTQTNIIYVATTGSNSNFGLSSSNPVLTVQKACDIVASYGPRLAGRWQIVLAAGTYTENVTFDSMTDSEYPILIKGPTAGHPNVPTAIIAASDTSSWCLRFTPTGWFQVTDVLLSGATTGEGVSTNGSRLTLTNVHMSGCQRGLACINASVVSATGGIWTGLGKAVSGGQGYSGLFNVMHDIGGASTATATQISDFEVGMLIDEGTQGHLDYTQISDCGTGVQLKRGAGACNTKSVEITSCDVGVLAENNGWFNNGIVFTTCTVNVRTLGSAPEYVFVTDNNVRTTRVLENKSYAAHTGTVAETQIWQSITIPAWAISEEGHTATVKINGNCTLTANASVRVYFYNGTTLYSLGTSTIPSGSTTYEAIYDVWHYMSTGIKTARKSTTASAVSMFNSTSAIVAKDLACSYILKIQLGNSADSMDVQRLVFTGTYGG